MSDLDTINLVLLVFRVAIGLVILAHGVNHIIGGGKIQGTASWFESIGMRPPLVQAWLASLTEIGAGVLLVLGLLTPFGSAGLLGVMIVAWVVAHRKNGFFIFRPGQGWEYVAVLSACALAIGTVGPGDWSVDAALDWNGLTGNAGLLISLSGVVGAALLLAACWRPGD